MDITNPDQVAAAEVPLRTQASAFGGAACIYAPLYRQIGKAAFSAEPEDKLNEMEEIATSDVERALLYYLQNYNNGRPFIIAGHSQGSTLLLNVLTKRWGTLGVENKMIATFIIGWSITDADIQENPNIRMCEGPLDFNCFVSYNSVRDGAQSSTLQIKANAYVTNPLNWQSGQDNGPLVAASENNGSVFYNSEGFYPGFYPQFTSAQIIKNGLVCDIHNVAPLSSEYETGSYHADDISLFYFNIFDNLVSRIRHYPVVANGSTFSISASQIADIDTFQKKPEVFIEVNGKKKKLTILEKRKDFPIATVTCRYSQKNLQADNYPLYVCLKSEKHTPVELPVKLSVMTPANISITSQFGEKSGTITVTGSFFGQKAPKAKLVVDDDSGKSKVYSCKVEKPLYYADHKGNAGKSCMDISTGASKVTFALNKKIDASTTGTLKLEFESGYIEEIPFNR